jgi:aryl-phospho-beta-D-glucosidase BglC (GH1 family)
MFRRIGLIVAALLALTIGAAALSPGQRTVLFATPLQSPLGFNMSGAESSTPYFPTASEWAYAKSKGRTLVRLPIAWENIQTSLNGSLNTSYLANLKASLALAHSYGIGVIVDLHNSGCYAQSTHWGTGSPAYTYAGNAGASCPGTGLNQLNDGTLTASTFANVWSRLATALIGTPGLVGYGIMNEPTASVPVLPGTNLLFAPNGFADTLGSQAWFTGNAPVITRLTSGTNPVAGYGPAWHVTSGTGYPFVKQNITLAAVPYTLTCSFRDLNATSQVALTVDTNNYQYLSPTSSWQTDTPYTFTPTAGSHSIGFSINNGAGYGADVANCQLQLGSSATTYVSNSYLTDAQAAITAVRLVDPITAIYINGDGFSAYEWPWINWELSTLSGGNLIFEAHQYFCGSVALGGGATCSATYGSYGLSATAGVSLVTPFVSWLGTVGGKGFVGEFNVPGRATCTSCTIATTVMTVGGAVTGVWDVGESVAGAGVASGTVISSLGTGTGGTGTYNLSTSSTVAVGEAMTGVISPSSPWYILQGNFEQYLAGRTPAIPATMWNYGVNGTDSGDVLQFAPANGNDDPRVTQMRKISP